MTKTYNDIEAVTRLLEEVNMTANIKYNIYIGVCRIQGLRTRIRNGISIRHINIQGDSEMHVHISGNGSTY